MHLKLIKSLSTPAGWKSKVKKSIHYLKHVWFALSKKGHTFLYGNLPSPDEVQHTLGSIKNVFLTFHHMNWFALRNHLYFCYTKCLKQGLTLLEVKWEIVWVNGGQFCIVLLLVIIVYYIVFILCSR
jgi:hypothetical protein